MYQFLTKNILFGNDTDYEMIQKLKQKSAVSINVKHNLKKVNIDANPSKIELLKILENYLNQELKKSNILEEGSGLLKAKFNNVVYEVESNDNQVEIFRNIEKKVEISDIITRLMCGELYGCVGIYETNKNEYYESFLDANTRFMMEIDAKDTIKNLYKISLDIAFHPIRDRNKTKRKLEIKTLSSDKVTIGESTDCLLIGAFIKNKAFSTFKLEVEDNIYVDRVEAAIYEFLSQKFQDKSLKRIKLYDEYKSII